MGTHSFNLASLFDRAWTKSPSARPLGTGQKKTPNSFSSSFPLSQSPAPSELNPSWDLLPTLTAVHTHSSRRDGNRLPEELYLDRSLVTAQSSSFSSAALRRMGPGLTADRLLSANGKI